MNVRNNKRFSELASHHGQTTAADLYRHKNDESKTLD